MTLAMHEEVVDAEIVPSKIEALSSIERAIEHAEGFWAEILWQVENRVWESLNYADFDALWADRYSTLGVRIDRRERPELVLALRSIGETQQQVAEKLGVRQSTVSEDLKKVNIEIDSDAPSTITNSRGQERPATYKKREQPEPAAADITVDKTTGEIKGTPVAVIDKHKTPYRPGHVLATLAGNTHVVVGDDGRVTGTARMREAIEWAKANPSMPVYDATKQSGISRNYLSNAYGSLRKNGEIHPVGSTGRKPHEEFGVLATGVKHLGMSIEKFLTEGTIDFIEPDEIDYYMDGLKEGMAQLVKFQRAARDLHKSGQQ